LLPAMMMMIGRSIPPHPVRLTTPPTQSNPHPSPPPTTAMAHLLRAARASSGSLLQAAATAARPAPRPAGVVAARALATAGGSKPAKEVEPKTSFNEILDRATNIFFLTELMRGFWLSFEVSMKPKVTIK
jgi:microcystin-dependent protein